MVRSITVGGLRIYNLFLMKKRVSNPTPKSTPENRAKSSPITLSVDIGGTGIKMMALDASGKPISDRFRALTPARSHAGAGFGGARRSVQASTAV